MMCTPNPGHYEAKESALFRKDSFARKYVPSLLATD